MRYKQVKQSKCCSQESVEIGEVQGVARKRASPVAGKGRVRSQGMKVKVVDVMWLCIF